MTDLSAFRRRIRPDLLRILDRDDRDALLLDLIDRVSMLERSGYVRPADENTLEVGDGELPVEIVQPPADDPDSPTPPSSGGSGLPFTTENQVLYSGTGGAAKALSVGTDSFVARVAGAVVALQIASNAVPVNVGGTLQSLAIAASRFLGRKASGDVAAMTADEAMTVLGALYSDRRTQPVIRKSTAYTLQTTDYLCFIDGTFTLTFPTNPGSSFDGKQFLLKRINAGTCTLAAGSGDTINGAASVLLSGAWSGALPAWDNTNRNWIA